MVSNTNLIEIDEEGIEYGNVERRISSHLPQLLHHVLIVISV